MSTEGLTDEQFQKILKMVLMILEDSKSKEEAVAKLKTLIEE